MLLFFRLYGCTVGPVVQFKISKFRKFQNSRNFDPHPTSLLSVIVNFFAEYLEDFSLHYIRMETDQLLVLYFLWINLKSGIVCRIYFSVSAAEVAGAADGNDIKVFLVAQL